MDEALTTAKRDINEKCEKLCTQYGLKANYTFWGLIIVFASSLILFFIADKISSSKSKLDTVIFEKQETTEELNELQAALKKLAETTFFHVGPYGTRIYFSECLNKRYIVIPVEPIMQSIQRLGLTELLSSRETYNVYSNSNRLTTEEFDRLLFDFIYYIENYSDNDSKVSKDDQNKLNNDQNWSSSIQDSVMELRQYMPQILAYIDFKNSQNRQGKHTFPRPNKLSEIWNSGSNKYLGNRTEFENIQKFEKSFFVRDRYNLECDLTNDIYSFSNVIALNTDLIITFNDGYRDFNKPLAASDFTYHSYIALLDSYKSSIEALVNRMKVYNEIVEQQTNPTESDFSEITGIITRIGAVMLALYMMQILLGLHRYYVKMKVYIEGKMIAVSSAQSINEIHEIAAKLSPENIVIGKEPDVPYDKLVELIKLSKKS